MDNLGKKRESKASQKRAIRRFDPQASQCKIMEKLVEFAETVLSGRGPVFGSAHSARSEPLQGWTYVSYKPTKSASHPADSLLSAVSRHTRFSITDTHTLNHSRIHTDAQSDCDTQRWRLDRDKTEESLREESVLRKLNF